MALSPWPRQGDPHVSQRTTCDCGLSVLRRRQIRLVKTGAPGCGRARSALGSEASRQLLLQPLVGAVKRLLSEVLDNVCQMNGVDTHQVRRARMGKTGLPAVLLAAVATLATACNSGSNSLAVASIASAATTKTAPCKRNSGHGEPDRLREGRRLRRVQARPWRAGLPRPGRPGRRLVLGRVSRQRAQSQLAQVHIDKQELPAPGAQRRRPDCGRSTRGSR